MEKFGGRVTAPMKRTTFGCRNLNIISIYQNKIKNIHSMIKQIACNSTELEMSTNK